MSPKEAIIEGYDGAEGAMEALVSNAQPLKVVEQEFGQYFSQRTDGFEHNATKPARFVGDEAERTARELAGLFINPEHLNLYNRPSVERPVKERPFNCEDYFVASGFNGLNGELYSAEIVRGWRDKSLSVIPAIALSRQEKLMMFCVPGVGLLSKIDKREEVQNFINSSGMLAEPEYIESVPSIELSKVIRHILITYNSETSLL